MTETTAFQFTRESAIAKVRAAEDAWNGQNPEQIALAYWRHLKVCAPDNDLADIMRTSAN
ncbi:MULTISPECIES: DUF1348 family protein [unclassified Sphingopyxis]|uniref:DUF1348 family protein n=1 Tax=unclassified Sphingopyxis TaxID=2614943 RepID=UPI000730924E|nr:MULTISPECIES: DUF1348 family protein [unclassified Sphingopyxis]KTE04799.1 hypothetical protein ATE76_23305 [Sphingopyxis sp. H093]KTE10328.1 hypothetical protein ATE70_10660 [Sphingopyxis sp. H053]KTE19537.1 hypothetical protein ATE75_21730 [Sphingopyxis sp. H080]KTE44833.1 hypothetical protein ATE77_09580 [Sphingopyxis sp. H005]